MHLLNLRRVFIFSIIFQVSNCQRRIVNGEKVSEHKRYVVYLVESRVSPLDYDEWLCGGALVSSDYIITSAACVEDVKHLYAIAGYDKYVAKDDIYEDQCTKRMKKKIVFTCVPKSYELDYGKLEKWSFIDIAVVQVESPYKFDDKDFETYCSYIPQPIEINFETKYQVEGIDAIALGWGHRIKWRTEYDKTSYNNVTLQYTPILIADKEVCKKEYAMYKGMNQVIDTYMICSIKEGNIDSKGVLRLKSKPVANGCPGHEEYAELMKFDSKTCDTAAEPDDMSWVEDTRRQTDSQPLSNNGTSTEINATKTKPLTSIDDDFDSLFTRRNGICQNDHGGPVVTWIGSEEYLIGVASVFKVNKEMECTGPFLYTSTECNGAFLACALGLEKNEESRRKMCSGTPEEKGFDTIETHISWKNHPDGPSDKDKHNESSTNTTEISQRARLHDSDNASNSTANKTVLEQTAQLNLTTSLDEKGVNKSLANATKTTLSIKQHLLEINKKAADSVKVNSSSTSSATTASIVK